MSVSRNAPNVTLIVHEQHVVRFFLFKTISKMENQIQVFNNPKFGEIRTTGSADNPAFCLTDVCKALGLTTNGITRRLQDDVISNHPIIDRLGRMQQALFVNEDGLYDVILDSRKPEARQFRKWVTGEVLPSIRKNGGYIATTQEDTPELIMARALQVAQATITKHQQMLEQANERISIQDSQIQKLQPKADFADAAFKAEGNVDIGQAAKILGLPFGRNTLFKKLREKGVFFGSRNEPKQRFIDAGYFKLTELPPIKRENHTDLIVMKCICTQKGLAYINMLFGGSFSKSTLTTIK